MARQTGAGYRRTGHRPGSSFEQQKQSRESGRPFKPRQQAREVGAAVSGQDWRMLFPEALAPTIPNRSARAPATRTWVSTFSADTAWTPTPILPDDTWRDPPSQLRRCHLLLRLRSCSRAGHRGRHLPGRSSHRQTPVHHFRLGVFVRRRRGADPPLCQPSWPLPRAHARFSEAGPRSWFCLACPRPSWRWADACQGGRIQNVRTGNSLFPLPSPRPLIQRNEVASQRLPCFSLLFWPRWTEETLREPCVSCSFSAHGL